MRTSTAARWPRYIPAGSQSHALIQYVDFLPTLNELAGGETMPDLDGKSFLPVLTGRTDQFREEVYGATFGFYSVRNSQFKYIWNSKPGQPFKHMFMGSAKNESTQLYEDLLNKEKQGNTKAVELLTWLRQPPTEELYNIKEDPFETNNLIANPEFGEVRDALRERLGVWLHTQADEALPAFQAAFPTQPKPFPPQ